MDLPVGKGTQGLRQWVLTDCTDMFNSKGHYSPWKFVRIGLPDQKFVFLFKILFLNICTTGDPEKEDEETCKPISDKSLILVHVKNSLNSAKREQTFQL